MRWDATAKLVASRPITGRIRYNNSSDAVAVAPAGEYTLVASDPNGGHYFVSAKPPVAGFPRPGAALLEDDHSAVSGGGLWRSPTGQFWVYWFWEKWKNPAMAPVDDARQVEVVPLPLAQGKVTFRRELVYTGRSGPTLTLLYREFSGDIARPAFSQPLQYDISADPVIGYQGARFRVLSADNTGITYEVLAQMGQ